MWFVNKTGFHEDQLTRLAITAGYRQTSQKMNTSN